MSQVLRCTIYTVELLCWGLVWDPELWSWTTTIQWTLGETLTESVRETSLSWVWWDASVILLLRYLRLGDYEFKTSLGYIVKSCLPSMNETLGSTPAQLVKTGDS